MNSETENNGHGDDGADTGRTVYEIVGGYEFFEQLVDRFYTEVAGDAGFLSMYPDPSDLTEARLHLTQFLVQYWGGPTTYSDERGHPRLRMRHVPFSIGTAERDTWLRHMDAALASAENLDPAIRAQMSDYFTMAANHLVNQG